MSFPVYTTTPTTHSVPLTTASRGMKFLMLNLHTSIGCIFMLFDFPTNDRGDAGTKSGG